MNIKKSFLSTNDYFKETFNGLCNIQQKQGFSHSPCHNYDGEDISLATNQKQSYR